MNRGGVRLPNKLGLRSWNHGVAMQVFPKTIVRTIEVTIYIRKLGPT